MVEWRQGYESKCIRQALVFGEAFNDVRKWVSCHIIKMHVSVMAWDEQALVIANSNGGENPAALNVVKAIFLA